MRVPLVLENPTYVFASVIVFAAAAFSAAIVAKRVSDLDLVAAQDLRSHACRLAGALLELGKVAPEGGGGAIAEATVADGRAWAKFQRICEAQGGMREPPTATERHSVEAASSGTIRAIDNRRISRLAKLAGAPDAKAAGIGLHVKLGNPVAAGQPLYTIHADTPGELSYALDYAEANMDIVTIDPA